MLDLGAAVLAVDHLVADLDIDRDAVAVVVNATRTTATTSPSWGFSLAVSGITRPDAVVCSASADLTTTLSSRGLIETDTADLTFLALRFGAHCRSPSRGPGGPCALHLEHNKLSTLVLRVLNGSGAFATRERIRLWTSIARDWR